MPITPQQARAELARRELAKRELSRRGIESGQGSADIPKPQSNPLMRLMMGGGVGRGMAAVEGGANIQDLMGLIAKPASGVLGGTPERIAEKPLSFAMGGVPGANLMSLAPPEQIQLPYPRPVTDAGKQLGSELEFVGGMIPIQMLAAKGLGATGQAIGKARYGTGSKALEKAEKLATEILQPSKTDLAFDIGRGRKLPAIEQGVKYIKQAKNYKELRQNLDNVLKSKFQERNFLMQQKNQPIKSNYVMKLARFIGQRQKQGQIKPSEIAEMKDVLQQEIAFLRKSGGMDVIKGQGRKEFLQDLTKSLLERAADGSEKITQPARKQALDILRKGLRESIEQVDPAIKRINSQYEGLREAIDLAAGQEALGMKAPTPGMIEKIIEKIPGLRLILREPGNIPIEVAKGASKRERSLRSVTSELDKIRKYI